MRTFTFEDQCGEHTVTEEGIMIMFFPYWSERMREVGKEDLISHENCIADFCTVNYAEENIPG